MKGRLRFLLPAVALLFVLLPQDLYAQSAGPFGVGAPSPPTGPADGFLREHLSWVYQQQAAFYKQLTGIVKEAKEDGSAHWWLILISFLYGVFHAAGPGHGKIVISSYVLANEETARRGVLISFLAAFAQGLTAVVLIGVSTFVLSMTSIAVTGAAQWFERASYLLIVALGFYLLWQKGLVPLTARLSSVSLSPARLSLAGHSHGHHHHDHGNGHRHHNHAHDHVHDHNCGCGGHAPDPKMLKQPLDVQSAAAAVLSVGLRPCTGALIVLVFAASQGLFLTGVISTFAMAFGTALTTSTLAVFALTAKTFATRYLSGGASAGFVFKSIEIAGAGLLIFFGGTLFAASMMA